MLCILLIGFNRPDLLQDRLDELLELRDLEISIRVSIDGPRINNKADLVSVEECLALIREYKGKFGNLLNLDIQAKNLGCDEHIKVAITKSLEASEATICFEDDIVIRKSSVQAILKKYSTCRPVIICGMSTFPLTNEFLAKVFKNKWRRTDYFSAWGYLITREFWDAFSPSTSLKVIEQKLAHSNLWRSLPRYKKRTWLERFQRGNIDYQIQLELWSKNFDTIAPTFRIVENLGLGDHRSTHTYFKRPLNMFGIGPSICMPDETLKSKSLQTLLIKIDSHTWAGDGFMSVRGRRVGIRSSITKLLKLNSRGH
jgi:hypothetical protein